MTRDQLRAKANELPLLPGVYLMMDKTGQVIYVGKAKKLKNRVSQYFQDTASHNEKTKMMVAHVDRFDTIIVRSEFEALVLENSLIKRHMPRYNILLKDDKGYPFVRLDVKADYPRFSLATRAAAYDVPFAVVDGTDPVAVYEAMTKAMDHARSGKGPYVVEAKVYRYQGHYCGDPAVYRPAEYMENALANDGIEKLGKKLMAMGVKEEDLEAIKKAAQEEMDEAVKFADESPYPDPSEVTDDMYTADNERCVAR